MFDPTKPVQTRRGLSVRVLCTDRPGIYSIVGLIDDRIFSWTKEGYYFMESQDHEMGLINIKTKKQGWLNLYPSKLCVHQTKELAELEASHTRIACIKIEWEE